MSVYFSNYGKGLSRHKSKWKNKSCKRVAWGTCNFDNSSVSKMPKMK